jgi:hypothetical protein
VAPGEDVRHYMQPPVPLMTTCERQVALAVFVTGSAYSLFFLYEPEKGSPQSYAFIRLVVCLTTGPKPLPQGALHVVRSRVSSFK